MEQIVDVHGPQFHEDIVEVTTAVRSVGAARSSTGSVKKWFKGKGFCFITPDDGGEDMYIHCKQLVDTEGLQQGETATCDTEYIKVQGRQLHRHIQRWRWQS